MENKLNLDEIEKLPAKERALLKKRHALHCKYEKAVTLYADTTLSTRIIALRCGVTPGALGNYLRRYWRELGLQRHQIPVESEDLQSIKIYSTGTLLSGENSLKQLLLTNNQLVTRLIKFFD